jgi:hypothetical protein
VRAEGDSETADLQLSYASLCHPCCPSSRDLRVAASHPSLKHVDHINSLGSGHRMPGPRIALRVARRMSCTQCRVIMVICPEFQRRLQICHGTKTGLLVGWVVSSSVEPVLTYCWHKIHIHSRFLLPFSGRRPAQCNTSSLTLDAGQAMPPTHIRPSCNTPKRRSRRSWTEA